VVSGAGRLSLRPELAAQVAKRLGIKSAAPAQAAAPSRTDVRAFWTQLAEGCPGIAAFDRGAIRPLKIGIREDIEARFPDVPRRTIKRFLAEYCGRGVYFTRTTAGAERIDLDGKVAGSVSEEAAENASRRLQLLEERQALVELGPQQHPGAHGDAAGPEVPF
jgi:sRNA-binding protein